MEVREHEALSVHTTFRLGGEATVFVEAHTEEDVVAALALARERGLSLRMLGGGSNVLVPDAGIHALVLSLASKTIVCTDTVLVADAGASWNDVVDEAARRELWGIENLAGIPGTVGGAAVQNIGAYGAELSEVFLYADVVHLATGARERISASAAEFGYRMSRFKKNRAYAIVRVALTLQKTAEPKLSYKDLAVAKEAGVPLATPREIAEAVRAIRARKFPDLKKEGTAGSFFKNPVVSLDKAAALAAAYPALPQFPQEEGTVKISLAWLLDHALSLKGYAQGNARLFESQPLVIVTSAGATASDVETLARDVASRVQEATGVVIEREVETFSIDNTLPAH